MSSRYTVSRARIDALLASLARLEGFLCLDQDRGDRQRVSALPMRHWVFPAGDSGFPDTVSQILQQHQQLALAGGAGAIAGHLFYETGQQTVPGFRSTRPELAGLGWAGLYLWDLSIPRDGDALLSFHDLCPTEVRERVLACLESPLAPEPPARFRITTPFRALGSAQDYRSGVDRILAYIRAGDCYQVNLSQAFEGEFLGSPWLAWQALRQAIPVPHGGYLDTGDWQLLSISPELFLEIDDRTVTSKPIKGTRPRSESPSMDRELARELAANPKDRAENLMIVDLIRNDLSHFCEPFSVRVPQLFEVESYRNVHQLVSTITGTLRADTTPFEALLSAFPGGSITGAPKRRAMEIIHELEAHSRGPYCGSLFWWGADNRLQSNIAIRTLQTRQNGTISAWAGCGIVADSEPEAEYQESLTKIRHLLDTLQAMGPGGSPPRAGRHQ